MAPDAASPTDVLPMRTLFFFSPPPASESESESDDAAFFCLALGGADLEGMGCAFLAAMMAAFFSARDISGASPCEFSRETKGGCGREGRRTWLVRGHVFEDNVAEFVFDHLSVGVQFWFLLRLLFFTFLLFFFGGLGGSVVSVRQSVECWSADLHRARTRSFL